MQVATIEDDFDDLCLYLDLRYQFSGCSDVQIMQASTVQAEQYQSVLESAWISRALRMSYAEI